MPTMAIYRSKTVTRAQYEDFRASLPLAAAPAEALVHALVDTGEDGLTVVEIWESREALEAYNRAVVDPALRAQGIEPTAPEILEVATLAVTTGAKDYVLEARKARALESA